MKRLLILAGLAVLATIGLAVAQTPLVTYVQSMRATDVMPIVPGAMPTAQQPYATLLQLQSYFFSSNSQHVATAPALTSCGTSPAISGTDWAGTVTLGTGTPTGCVITFNVAYTGVPYCVVSSQTAPGTTTPAYSVTATAITTVQAANSSNKIDYICVGRQGG